MWENNYVLVLPSWYPSEADAFNGDFNLRTVDAMSAHLKQVVIYITPHSSVKSFKVDKQVTENLITILAYFPKSSYKLIDFICYINIYYKLIKILIKQKGKPLYIHTYVFFPAGILSWYFARRLKIKQVLTEHWSILYPANEFSISKKFIALKFLFSRLLRSFDLIFPVVDALRQAIMHWAPMTDMVVIPNVVNTSYFQFDNVKKYNDFTFLHVSCMESHKNPIGILNAFEVQLASTPTIKLKFIGPVKRELEKRVGQSYLLNGNVEFLGEMQNSEVAKVMQKSHVLIMNSFYESLPCVILEALCCGLPVISSNVGGISEVIDEHNGILFNQGNLLTALGGILSKYPKYNSQTISRQAIGNFSYAAVSNETISILKRKKIIDA